MLPISNVHAMHVMKLDLQLRGSMLDVQVVVKASAGKSLTGNTTGERCARLSFMYSVAAVAALDRSSGPPQALHIARSLKRSLIPCPKGSPQVLKVEGQGGTSRETGVHLYSAPITRADPTPIARVVQPFVL